MQGASYMQAWWLAIEVPKKARENSSKNTFDPTAFLRSGPLQNREQSVVPTGVKGCYLTRCRCESKPKPSQYLAKCLPEARSVVTE